MSVTIAWEPRSARQLPEGGDEESTLVEFLAFDGTASETYEIETTATEHPIEEGADVTDHLRRSPMRLTLEVIVSKHAPTGAADADDEHRVETARTTIAGLIRDGIETEITTGTGSWPSMVLLTCTETRTQDTGEAYRATVTAREIRRVAIATVDAPSPRVERARRTAQRGQQSGDAVESSAPVSASPGRRESELHQAREDTAEFREDPWGTLARMFGGS